MYTCHIDKVLKKYLTNMNPSKLEKKLRHDEHTSYKK